ncbi:MAG: DUF814 domain-containing protein, partial [Deltaproteobacteria bacterium]|nr:DUF814 domain-containing protein [Deltaproteobacteria bacterium]
AAARGELAYLDDLAYQVEEARDADERAALAALLGLEPRTHGRRPAAAGKPGKAAAGEKSGRVPPGVETHHLPGGAVVYVGKNAAGNEQIYRRLSRGDDLWFHARNLPGAHVLLKTPGGRPATEAEIEAAARQAARNSKGKNDSRVEVLCLPRKYLKKPKGGKPGQVLISGPQRTFTVRLPPT